MGGQAEGGRLEDARVSVWSHQDGKHVGGEAEVVWTCAEGRWWIYQTMEDTRDGVRGICCDDPPNGTGPGERRVILGVFSLFVAHVAVYVQHERSILK